MFNIINIMPKIPNTNDAGHDNTAAKRQAPRTQRATPPTPSAPSARRPSPGRGEPLLSRAEGRGAARGGGLSRAKDAEVPRLFRADPRGRRPVAARATEMPRRFVAVPAHRGNALCLSRTDAYARSAIPAVDRDPRSRQDAAR